VIKPRRRAGRGMWHVCAKREMHTVFFGGGGPEGRRSFGRSRHRWRENIKTDLEEMEGRGLA